MESKEIKVYGTLVNETVGTVTDSSHNDILMNAYLLYDSRFINNGGVNNYQDVINKRVTAITYADGLTTITGDLTITGNIIGLDQINNLSDLHDVDMTGNASGKYLKYNGTKWVPVNISISEITGFAGLDDAQEGLVLKYVNGKWSPSMDLVVTTLSGLSDVNTAGSSNGNYLKYNGTNWVPASITVSDISNGVLLSDLTDVNTSGATSGSVLKYNGTSWVIGSDNAGNNGATNLNELSDVDTTGALNGSILKYNGTAWVVGTDNTGNNGATTLDGLNDVDTTGASTGSILKYNGTSWVVGTDNTGNNGATNLNELSDVTLSSSSSNQVLSYNGSQWVNKTISLSDLSMPSAQEGQVLKYSNGSWIAANDEQGSGQSGTQLGVYTEVRTFQKIGEVSNTFFQNRTFTEGMPLLVSNYSGYMMEENDKMNMYINPIRNKYYIYTAPGNTDPDKPENVGLSISKFEGLPSNMYSYSYKNNNILTQVSGTTGSNAIGLPDFSSASTQEGTKIYYRTTPSMSVNLWTGYTSNKSGAVYELNSTLQNGYFSRTGDTITVTSESDDSFLRRTTSFVDGNSVKYYHNNTLTVTTTSGLTTTDNLSLSEIKNALILNNIPAILPGYFFMLIFAADDIDMPLTLTQTVVYNYIV